MGRKLTQWLLEVVKLHFPTALISVHLHGGKCSLVICIRNKLLKHTNKSSQKRDRSNEGMGFEIEDIYCDSEEITKGKEWRNDIHNTYIDSFP